MKRKTKAQHPPPGAKARTAGTWRLKLYIADKNPSSARAITNLKSLSEKYLGDHHLVDILDLLKNPERCGSDQIIAIPTLVKLSPGPIARLLGDLSNTKLVLEGLGLAA